MKRGKSPAGKVQKEKKLSGAQLGDADCEEDDNDDDVEVKKKDHLDFYKKKSETFRGERETHSPEHIYHQIGSDSLIRFSKKSTPIQGAFGSSSSRSRQRHFRHEDSGAIENVSKSSKIRDFAEGNNKTGPIGAS